MARHTRTIDSHKIGLDAAIDISGIECHGDIHRWIATALMTQDNDHTATKLANIEAVLGYVREVRGGLDAVGAGLEPQPAESAAGFLRELRNGLSTTLITLGLLEVSLRKSAHLPTVGRGTSSGPPTAASIPDEDTAPAPGGSEVRLAEYVRCRECSDVFVPTAPHTCDDTENSFYSAQLDLIHGKGGWVAFDEPEKEEAPSVVSPPSASSAVEPKPTAGPEVPAAAIGMRDGSKKHRVYMEVKRLLEQNGSMHIDDMLEGVIAKIPGVFADVKDSRTNFANLLSALRSKQLVVSDYQGIYSLPKQNKAAA